jgi:hypothetical protein
LIIPSIFMVAEVAVHQRRAVDAAIMPQTRLHNPARKRRFAQILCGE